MDGVRRGLQRRRLASSGPRRSSAPGRSPTTSRSAALAAGEGQGPLRRRRRRRGRGREPRARQGRAEAVDGRLGAAAGRDRPSGRRWRTAPRSSTTTSAPTMSSVVGLREGRLAGSRPAPTQALLRGPRPREGHRRVLPRAADPERHGAAERPGRSRTSPRASSRSTRPRQIPHFMRTFLRPSSCGIPEAKMRVIAPDVGGGFGSKLEHYAEEAVAVALARELGRARQVDGGALRGLPRHHPRPRPVPATWSWRRRATGT